MENLNAEQVKKALECCTSYCDKDNCPYKTHDIPVACMTMRMVDALALINSQEQRIKELDEELDAMRGSAEAWKGHSKTLEGENENLKNLVDKCFDTENALNEKIKELTEENERLRAIPEQLHKEMSERMVEERKIERKLAVRKMQERAIATFNFGDDIMYSQKLIHEVINHIAKEMLEAVYEQK